MKTINYDDRNFKQKVKDFIEKCKLNWKIRKEKIGAFCTRHENELLLIAIISLPGLLKIGNNAIKNARVDKEEKRRKCDYYDPRTGKHWYTRKPLNTKEELEFERRYRNGESTGDILNSMHKF